MEENPIKNRVDIIENTPDEELEQRYLKVNIPSNMDSYHSGNGEGCWAIPLSDEDKVIIDEDKPNTIANVILCNSSIYIPPLVYGSVIKVEMRSGYRPVLDVHWMHEILKAIDIDFLAILNGEYEEDEED